MFFRWLRRLLLWHTCQWDGHVWDDRLCDFQVVAGEKQFRKQRVCRVCLATETTEWE